MPAVTVELESPPALEWTPPTVYEGQELHWFPQGERNADYHRAVALRDWGGGKLKLALISRGIARTYTDAVRHIDDPWFQSHPLAAREDGCWDFPPVYKAQAARDKNILDEIQSLTARVDALESKPLAAKTLK